MGLANDDDPIFFYHKMPQSSRGRAFDGVVTPSEDGVSTLRYAPPIFMMKEGENLRKGVDTVRQKFP
jgi:hypothetical protein